MNFITHHACMDSMTYAPTRSSVRADTATTQLVVGTEPAFDFASAEYRVLHQRSRASAFQGAHWLAGLNHDVAPAVDAKPFTVRVRDAADGRLMLVLPLARHRMRGVTFLGFADFGLCDYVGPIYDPADVPLLLADDSLPRRIAGALPDHDVLQFTKLNGSDPLLEYLFPSMQRARMRVSAYPARLNGDWTAWRSTNIDQSFRRYLDMKRRRLKRTGTPHFRRLRDPDAIASALEALRRYRSERFRALGVPDLLDHNAIFEFYKRMAIEGARDGFARTHCLYLSGEPVAITFGVAQRGVYALLLVGLDVARHSRLSPGLLAIEDTLRESIEAGDSTYDFTIGDHPYKLQFGGQANPLFEWHQARTLRGHAAVLAITLVRETKRTLKPLVKRVKERLIKSASAAA